MNGLKFILPFVFAVCFEVAFANSLEGIFIESISHISGHKLTLDEIRSRPLLMPVTTSKGTFVEVDGYYVAESVLPENPHTAKDRARANARRAASEQALIYVKAISELKKGNLAKDELNVLSLAVIHIESEDVTEKKIDEGTEYHCHLKVYLNDAEEFLEQVGGDKDSIYENIRCAIEIERESAKLNADLTLLKKRYKHASKAERNEIEEEVKLNEKAFSVTVWNKKGFECYNRKDFSGAITCFSNAIALSSDNFAAYNGLAYVENYQNRFDRAIEYGYKAIEIMPSYSAAWNNLGYAYAYKGNLEQAIECYQKAAELSPKDAAPLVNLGNIYESFKDYNKAISMYEKALSIDLSYDNAWNSLGYVYAEKGENEKAVEYFEKAIDLNKNSAAAWNGLAYVYNQKKKYYKAIACSRKAVGLNKNYANAWNNLGYACAKVGRNEDSWTAYRAAVKIAPKVDLYRKNLEIANERIESFKSL